MSTFGTFAEKHFSVTFRKCLLINVQDCGSKFKIRRSTTCSTKNVIYVAYCSKCGLQGIGSTIALKPRLANYKSHIKKGIHTCKIVMHFIDVCKDTEFPLRYLRFVIVDVVNNT